MRLLFILVTITLLSEAKKRRPERKKVQQIKNDNVPREGDESPGRLVPVPFGHIFKEGFQPNLKQPIDLLELDRTYSESADKLREQHKEIQWREQSQIQHAARAKERAEKRDLEMDKDGKEATNSRREERMWLDLAGNQARNLDMTRRRGLNLVPQIPQEPPLLRNPAEGHKAEYFSKMTFGLESNRRRSNRSWTTCSEFGHNADFNPRDVINIKWVPFYTWSDEIKTTAYVHKFSIPTVKLVQKYKREFGPYLNQTVDWNEPKLLMKSDVEILLIAADRRGLFNGIPYNEVPPSMKDSSFKLPILNLRLKIVDPYLAMMFCDYRYAIIMAVAGSQPVTLKDMRTEAATLKFNGRGFPTVCDLEAEIKKAEHEREMERQRDLDKFLEVDDPAGFKFPFE